MATRPFTRLAAPAAAFSEFPDDVAAALRAAAVHRAWANGEVVLPQGRVVEQVVTVLQGRLRMATSGAEGLALFFRWHLPGEIAGMVSAIADLPFPVEAVAFDDCETLQLDRHTLLSMMQTDARVACAAARLVARHTYDVVNLVSARTESTLTSRVLKVLRHLALLNGRPDGVGTWTLAVSQQDVASAVGASRPRVNAEMRSLERAGQIQLGYRHVRVFGLPSAASRELKPR